MMNVWISTSRQQYTIMPITLFIPGEKGIITISARMDIEAGDNGDVYAHKISAHMIMHRQVETAYHECTSTSHNLRRCTSL